MTVTVKKDSKNPRDYWNLLQLQAKIEELINRPSLDSIVTAAGKGLLAKTGENSWALRSIVISGSGFNSVENANGSQGNPTLSLDFGAGGNQVAVGNHNHVGIYALVGHLHVGIYEPTITPGTDSQFWRGDKTWQDLMATIASKILCYEGEVLTYENEVLYA